MFLVAEVVESDLFVEWYVFYDVCDLELDVFISGVVMRVWRVEYGVDVTIYVDDWCCVEDIVDGLFFSGDDCAGS